MNHQSLVSENTIVARPWFEWDIISLVDLLCINHKRLIITQFALTVALKKVPFKSICTANSTWNNMFDKMQL